MSDIKNVFVSDIPFDLTEDKVRQLLNTAGRIVNFRLVYDKEKQRHKGYAFVEYETSDEANKAVQTLNRMQLLGRQLRVSISRDNRSGGNQQQRQFQGNQGGADQYGQDRRDRHGQQNNYNNNNQGRRYGNQGYQNQPPQHSSRREVVTSLVVDDEISRTLSQFPPEQIVELLSTMKSLIKDNPAQAKDVLLSNPNLAYCVAQALLLMGIADSNVISQVVAAHQQQSANPSAPEPTYTASPQLAPPPPVSGPGPSAPYQRQAPDVSQRPPQQQPPSQQPADPQFEMVRKILELSEEQVNQLPADQQAQVRAIKQQYGHMMRA